MQGFVSVDHDSNINATRQRHTTDRAERLRNKARRLHLLAFLVVSVVTTASSRQKLFLSVQNIVSTL